MTTKTLTDIWREAASDLCLNVEMPSKISLNGGGDINADILVRDFGAKMGMLVVGDYNRVEPYLKKITENGYGYSVMSDPNEGEEYNRSDFISLLRDWGWRGDTEAPRWLRFEN